MDNTRENNWWNYRLGSDRNALAGSAAENEFSLGQGRLGIDRFNAETNRGRARSDNWWQQDQGARDWQRFGPTGNLTGYEDRRPGYARR